MFTRRAARRSKRRGGAALLFGAAIVAGALFVYAKREGFFLPAYERRVLPLVRALGPHRPFSARLGGGFRPGPVTGTTRGVSSSPNVALLAAAAAIESQTRRDPSPENLRALAAAHLLLGNYDDAIEGLGSLVRKTPEDPDVWSDLGAAYLIRAEKTGKSADLPRALEHSLHARQLAPRSSEALVNQALALDALHLHDDALSAWMDAGAVERDALWLAEIGERRERRGSEPWLDRDRFFEEVSRATAAGRLEEVARLATESPEGIRSWLLSRGLRSAADPRSRENLARIQPILAKVLQDPDGPDALAEVLTLTERDRVSVELLSQIASLHDSNRWGEAERLLDQLRPLPALPPHLRGWRELWQGVTDLQHGNSTGARVRFDALIASLDETRQPFLKGRAHYTRSVIASSGGQPDLAIRHRREAARLFTLAGEPAWAAFAGQQVGESHGKLGLTEIDWDERLLTLKLAPRLFNPQTALLAVTVVGDDLVRSNLPRAAAAVYGSAQRRAVAAHLQDSAADTSAGIALALRVIDNPRAREAALTASRMASTIEDPLLRARMSGEALRVRATVEPENEVLMKEALEWLGKRGSWGRQIPLMTAHGLALANAGRIEAARTSLEDAVALYDANRPSDPELSDAGSDQIRPAYAALAEIESAGGDSAALAELARHYWMAASNVGAPALRSNEPASCTLAFVPTSRRVLSWFTCGSVTRFHGETITADQRRDLVNAFVAARRAGLPGANEGVRLSALLLTPWAAEIRKARSLSLTVTEDLARLPFAALPLEGSSELGRSLAISYSPTPSTMAAPAPVTKWRSPLVVAALPEGPEFPALPYASAEAAALARRVGGQLLERDRATTENTLALLPRSDFFYFSGHALVNVSRPFDSSLVLVDSANRASFLTIRRVRSLDLRGLKLAVLAGCSTAEAGDVGSMTLAGAFLAAGAESVVGTLWPVPDEAMSRLMPRFFDHVESERSPAAALARLRGDRSLTNADRAVVDALAVSEFVRAGSVSSGDRPPTSSPPKKGTNP